MQLPGPTLIVTEGETVTVTLTNNLPAAAGNTSILFPGFDVSTATGGVAGLLTQEAAHRRHGDLHLHAPTTPGTHAYYSGTQGDLQVEMGLYGAIIVLPTARIPAVCTTPDCAARATLARERRNGATRLPPGGGRLQPPVGLLRPRVPVPVLRDGSRASTTRPRSRSRRSLPARASADRLHGRRDRAVPSRRTS